MATKITKRVVDATKPGPKVRFIFDSEIQGFGLRVTPNGAKSYVVQYGSGDHKRRMTLGRHGSPWTAQAARDEALRLLGRVASGEDPAALRGAEKASPTLAEFAERFLTEHTEAKNKPSTAAESRRLLERYVLPQIGKRRLSKLRESDVARVHYELRKTPYQANRSLGVLSKLCGYAETTGIRERGSNPCRFIERYREERRERYLSAQELGRLGVVLAEAAETKSEPWQAIAAIRLLLLTGRRRGEILTMRWCDVDLDQRRLTLPDSKTGRKHFPLAPPALEILSSLPRYEDSPFVLPGLREGNPFVGLSKVWQRLRKLAKLSDVRLHDLRHAYASVGVQSGESLPMIGALLGHTTPAMTARYSHLSDDPVRAAAERTAKTIAEHLSAEPTRRGRVVGMRKK